ncbi:hypothetical protein K439DRAFT_1356493 [Ramaria rubella]|nr:hypothetical protein K439DRAFT_1356493 [Ramaria rubella]
MSKFDKNPPGHWILKFYRDLPCRSCSLITQLRTGHASLNGFLHHINVVDSAMCPPCHPKETVEHYLLHCHRYTTHRHILCNTLGHDSFTLSNLLANPDHTKPLLAFVHATTQFAHYIDFVDSGSGNTAPQRHP